MTSSSPVAPVSPPRPCLIPGGGELVVPMVQHTGKRDDELMPVDGDPSELVPDDADGDDEVANELEDESEESQQLKRTNDPVLPSKEEIEAHRRTHLPYRSWCKFCIAGRGTGIPHASMPHQSRIPIVHLDYFFVTSSGVLTRQELETQYPKTPEGAIALDPVSYTHLTLPTSFEV